MAKKFTDADKWKKRFFRDLPLEGKLAWLYLCDNCDHAGIWIVDIETFNTQTGLNFTLEALLQMFSTHIIGFDNGERIWLKTYFNFQYADANDSFSAKKSALKILNKYGLVCSDSKQTPPLVVPESPQSGTCLLGDGMPSTIISNIIINPEGGVGETIPETLPEQIALAWKHWNETLAGSKLGSKKISPADEKILAQTIKQLGFVRVRNALIGKRFEEKNKNYDPSKNLSLGYCLLPNSKGITHHERLENLYLASLGTPDLQSEHERAEYEAQHGRHEVTA